MTTFYAACLASYNNGVLHGVHVEVSTDVDAMHDQIAAMLRASKFPNVTVKCAACSGDGTNHARHSDGQLVRCEVCKGTGSVPSAEEWQVHDWDDETGIFSPLGETSDLKAIAKLAELAECAEDELGSDWAEIVEAYCDHMGHSYVMQGEASDIVESIREAYAGTFDSLEAWAEEFLEDTGALRDVPDSLRNYIDFAAWARDAEYGGDIFTHKTSGQVHVFWNR